MQGAAAAKAINEGLLDLDDQWSNDLTVISQLDQVPTGPHDPSVVLCTLEGTLSDYSESTRNDRWYSERLWDRVLNSEGFQELVRTRTLFGESDHPLDIEDRFDVHYNYVSHCVRDVVHDRQNQCVRGKIDVLDTPAGRIIFTFVKYGSILGVSSRGAGDLIDTGNRIEVDPDSYQFYAWDIVHRPSNRKARVNLSESMKPSNRLTTLIESAKEDKTSLGWIRHLVESTEVPDKSELLDKVNEYIEMFDDNQEQIDEASIEKIRSQYINTIDLLKSDVISLTKQVIDLQTELADARANVQSSSLAIDTTQLEELLNKFNKVQTKLTESIDSQNKEKSIVQDVVEEIGDEILDRIDEAFDSLVKPIIATERVVKPMGELIKANGDFVVGQVTKLLPAAITVNDEELLRLQSELKNVQSQLSNSDKEKIKLNEEVKKLQESKVVETKKYLALRCNQLGLNVEQVLRKLGNVSEYTFDEIDDELSEIYQTSPNKPQRRNQTMRPVNTAIGRGELVIDDNGVSDKPSAINESQELDHAGLLSLIKNNV